MTGACPLCDLDTASDLEIFRDATAVALLADEQATRGHAVLVSTTHVEHLSDLDERAHAGFAEAYARLERALLEEPGVDRVVAVKLGLVVPHLHVHLYPIPATATRDDVVAMIERRVRDRSTPDELRALVERLRRRARREASTEE